MALRCVAAISVAIFVALGCLAAPAHADPRADIAAKARAAMASYDAMDYDAARRQLNQALAMAKRARLDKDPVAARVYLDLGIAQLAGSDQEAARLSFLAAVQIDPKIAIDPAYKSAELVRMLDEAKAAGRGEADDDCRGRGIQLTPIAGARRGVAQPIEVLIGGDLSPARVVVMYRPEGAIDFTEGKLARQGGCRYTGAIPGAAMHGAIVHYYVAAYDASNRVIAARGSSASPGVLELTAASPRKGRRGAAQAPRAPVSEPPPEEILEPAPEPSNPVTGSGQIGANGQSGQAGPINQRGSISTSGPAGSEFGETGSRLVPEPRDTAESAPRADTRGSRFVVAVSGGTGFGYVSGKTEGENVVQTCCIGTSPVVIEPEFAYRLTPRWSLGGVARFGLPLGANIMGHSTLAPAGFARVGYGFSDSGDGVHVMAELGFGILRNTIKLNTMTPGMDVDVVAQGPILVGAGIGYAHRVAGPVALSVDLDAMAGFAIIDKLGTAVHLNTGISGDLRLGFAVGF